jgi:selenoprotein W-related protein
LAAKIRDVAGIKSVKLIPSGGGAFEICVNGELIHSKLDTGEWPDFDAIAQQIRSKVGKK